MNEALTLIQGAAHETANIIFGAVLDERLGNEVKITVIADRLSQRPGTCLLSSPKIAERISAPEVSHSSEETLPVSWESIVLPDEDREQSHAGAWSSVQVTSPPAVEEAEQIDTTSSAILTKEDLEGKAVENAFPEAAPIASTVPLPISPVQQAAVAAYAAIEHPEMDLDPESEADTFADILIQRLDEVLETGGFYLGRGWKSRFRRGFAEWC